MTEYEIDVDGPHKYTREQPDGTVIEWELTFLGDGEPGTTLPFLISDHTPRELRIGASDQQDKSPIVSIDEIILLVTDLEEAITRFETLFEFDAPKQKAIPSLNATLVTFDQEPLTLVEPYTDSWLMNRLNQFGPCPIAYVLQLDQDCISKFEIDNIETDQDIRWLPMKIPAGKPYIGIITK